MKDIAYFIHFSTDWARTELRVARVRVFLRGLSPKLGLRFRLFGKVSLAGLGCGASERSTISVTMSL